ncbi:MAG: MOSC N-terminal beta barrel domain-containing protein [Pyrinomonadaceae bacterium]
MVIGKVREIWRYPVKSMGGEKLDRCAVGLSGIPGDRGWALRDEAAGEIRGAKYLPKLMQCSSRYREQPTDEKIPHVDITLPDGTRVGSDEPNVNSRLSELLGRVVSLRPLQPASDKAHYRRAQPGASVMSRLSRFRPLRPHLGTLIRLARLEAPTREMFSREPDEPLPDFSAIPSELFEFTSPPGTYFDLAPIHLLTTSSLAAMLRLNPAAVWDARRFRPNFLIETESDIEGLVEAGWSGQALRLGELTLKCELPTVRCGMTTHAQAELPKDPTVLRTVVREAGQNLGIYASVVSSSCIVVGDAVELL